MKIDSVIKILPINRSPEPGSFVLNSIKESRRINANPCQTLPKDRTRRDTYQSFYEASIIQTQKPEKNTTRKESHRPTSLMSRLPRWLNEKNPPANARDTNLIPGLGRSPGEGNGNQLQYSCPENPMDRGAWQAAVPGVSKSQTQLKPLSTAQHTGKCS